ncbi:MAG: acetate--CoA ligase family protein [Deltaproteobacteria bacterium]|nr:acetate--CoA ligase family protein [Deltaproteobacteria bacterium]
MKRSLEKVFNPGSIAVIGASEVPGKAAERRTRSLIKAGYTGDIYLINPKRDELFGMKAYHSITEIPTEVDLVMVVVAPKFVSSAVADSIKMGAKGIIIITAGLGESGEEGKRIEAEILSEAAKTGAYVIGPNCSGMFNASANINMLGIPTINKGAISILTQSGNVIDSLTHFANMKGCGFNKMINVGNAIGVKLDEYVTYLKDDPDTKVIATYLEGIRGGNELVRVAREAARTKPIIALKVGKSSAGARATASHTGSLAGDDAIVDAAFRQAGIVRVSNPDEMIDMGNVFSKCPLPKGDRVVIMSEGGGDNSIAADNAEKYGMQVPVLSKETQEKILPVLLAGMPAHNPIDYGGTAEENPHVITECVKACMEADEVDGILITGFFGGFFDIIAPHIAELEEQTAWELVDLVRTYQKPLIVNTSYARDPIAALDILKEAGIPVIESSDRAAQCMSALMRFAVVQKKIRNMRLPEGTVTERPEIKALFSKVTKESRHNLLETESRELLAGYGVSLPDAVLAKTAAEAMEAADRLGYPLAMKIVSPDIIHKSDAGGIRLNLSNADEVQAAFDEIARNAEKVTTRDKIVGVLLSPMVPPGQECIIGMVRDAQFGPVIMFGLGGIFVEVLKDVSFRVAPLADEDIDEMIKEIKGYRILTGVRGEKPKDIEAIKEVLSKLSGIVIDNPEISEVDLNPVIVHEKGLSIVDSRILIA